MAKSCISCICPNCKTEFTWEKHHPNRRVADEWEEFILQGEEVLDDRLCPDCYREKQIAEELEIATQIEKEYNLPTLEGTEKQVSWARQIRGKFFNNHKFYFATLESINKKGIRKDKVGHYCDTQLKKRLEEIINESRASKWIDYKYNRTAIIKNAQDLEDEIRQSMRENNIK